MDTDEEDAMHLDIDTTTGLTALHARELQAEGRGLGLARAAARCCPTALRRAGRAALAWLRHGQLGTGYAGPCCA